MCLLLLPAGAIALAVFALVDAAYSGDWSRIGAINKEQELSLQASWPQEISCTGRLSSVEALLNCRQHPIRWICKLAGCEVPSLQSASALLGSCHQTQHLALRWSWRQLQVLSRNCLYVAFAVSSLPAVNNLGPLAEILQAPQGPLLSSNTRLQMGTHQMKP